MHRLWVGSRVQVLPHSLRRQEWPCWVGGECRAGTNQQNPKQFCKSKGAAQRMKVKRQQRGQSCTSRGIKGRKAAVSPEDPRLSQLGISPLFPNPPGQAVQTSSVKRTAAHWRWECSPFKSAPQTGAGGMILEKSRGTVPGGAEQAQTQICLRGTLQDTAVGFFQDERFPSLQFDHQEKFLYCSLLNNFVLLVYL